MSLKLITLNLEGDKHLEKALPFLQREAADVVCLQEVFAADLPAIAEALEMEAHFTVMTRVLAENKYGIALRGEWGISYLTNLPHTPVQELVYSQTTEIPIFAEPNDNRRVLVVSEVTKAGQVYRIGTTHFTWSTGGEISPEQERDFAGLLAQTQQFEDLVLAGDFNAPRGRSMFAKFSEHFIDHLPAHVTTTIDGSVHYAGDLQVVVDTIFSTPHYRVNQVQVVNGVSDHMAVVGEVSRV